VRFEAALSWGGKSLFARPTMTLRIHPLIFPLSSKYGRFFSTSTTTQPSLQSTASGADVTLFTRAFMKNLALPPRCGGFPQRRPGADHPGAGKPRAFL
jgi:hypothetical protein